MESLPDDIWHKILQAGIKATQLDRTDLCSLAIVSKHFDQLTQDPAFWEMLLACDFPVSFRYLIQAPSKDLYREEYERRKRFSFFGYPDEPRGIICIKRSSDINDFSLLAPQVRSRRRSSTVDDPCINEPISGRAKKLYYEKKPKGFDRSSKQKVIPNSKSYVRMNKPPRMSMPRKI